MGSFLTGVSKGQDGRHVQSRYKRMVSGKPVCTYCKGQHNSVHCNVVTNVKAHLEVVKRERLCFNCLGKHKSTHCNSKNRCRLCGMDDTPAPQSGTTQPSLASQLVQNATPQPTQLSQPPIRLINLTVSLTVFDPPKDETDKLSV